LKRAWSLAAPTLVLIAVAAGALVAPSGRSTAETATPSPAPTPYPPAISTITIRFVRNGEPVEVVLLESISQVTADGVDCTPDVLAVWVTITETEYPWPWPDPLFPYECRKGPPTSLRFAFVAWDGTQLATEVEWTGENIETAIEVPDSALHTTTPAPTVSPTPTAVPTVPPVQLPNSGGPVGNPASVPRTGLAAALALIVGMIWLVRASSSR
jgi:hypothetical protein